MDKCTEYISLGARNKKKHNPWLDSNSGPKPCLADVEPLSHLTCYVMSLHQTLFHEGLSQDEKRKILSPKMNQICKYEISNLYL